MKTVLTTLALITVASVSFACGENPQQQYGVNFEQIERAVEIYNERVGL